jgi:ribokinase
LVGEFVVLGRINIDIDMRVDTIPKKNEHVVCEEGHISFGGSAANFAAQASRLGVKTTLVSCVGDDPYGHLAVKEMSNIGVDTTCILILENQSTGLFVYTHDAAEDWLVVAKPGANKFLEKRLFEEENLVDAQVMHLAGSFPMMIDRAMELATTHGMILSLDPGRAAKILEFDRILKHTDLLFINQNELKDYFNIEPTEPKLRAFAKTFPGIVILKMGEKGAIATDGFEFCTSNIFEVPVVDTMGAGDSFAAGFITAWIRSENIEQALNMANAVAALTITKKGAQNGQPTLEETARFLRQHDISIEPVLKTFKTFKPVSKRRKSR